MKELHELETNKEVFDYVKENLLAQGKKSLYSEQNQVCYYRGCDDTKCAAGFLLTDDQYNPVFEGVTVCTIFKGSSKLEDLIMAGYTINESIFSIIKDKCLTGMKEELDNRLVHLLQDVHDNYYPSDWENALDVVENTVFSN